MPIRNLPTNVLSSGDEEMTLGGRIHHSRTQAGMSLQMLANLAGVKASTLKAWETDRSEPRVNKLVAMSGILGVSPTYFIAEEGNAGKGVSSTRGRKDKIISLLAEEIGQLNEDQKAINQRLRKINNLMKSLQ
ncbi:MAG: helix-turn-helix transcriptional regulator [Proteobacteria bacterium]|nr:helix-turn-helix transcriptional regulator [Pseudomonadota bacterium]